MPDSIPSIRLATHAEVYRWTLRSNRAGARGTTGLLPGLCRIRFRPNSVSDRCPHDLPNATGDIPRQLPNTKATGRTGKIESRAQPGWADATEPIRHLPHARSRPGDFTCDKTRRMSVSANRSHRGTLQIVGLDESAGRGETRQVCLLLTRLVRLAYRSTGNRSASSSSQGPRAPSACEVTASLPVATIHTNGSYHSQEAGPRGALIGQLIEPRDPYNCTCFRRCFVSRETNRRHTAHSSAVPRSANDPTGLSGAQDGANQEPGAQARLLSSEPRGIGPTPTRERAAAGVFRLCLVGGFGRHQAKTPLRTMNLGHTHTNICSSATQPSFAPVDGKTFHGRAGVIRLRALLHRSSEY